MARQSSFLGFAFLFSLVSISVLSQAPLPAYEVNALKAFYDKYSSGSTLSTWDFTQDPCNFYELYCWPVYGVKRVVQFSAASSNLQGNFPVELLNLTQLRYFIAGSNSLSGTLPAGLLWKWFLLQYIDISLNQFSGPIPTQIGHWKYLNSLNFGSNSFSGQIPAQIAKLGNLNQLDLSFNSLTGTIPIGVFYGSIPAYSSTYYSLSGNALTGSIPTEIGFLSTGYLSLVDFSYNYLSGTVPTEICLLQIGALNLNQNNLVGRFPGCTFENTGLYSINITYNSFSGALGQIGYQPPPTEALIVTGNNICPLSYNYYTSTSVNDYPLLGYTCEICDPNPCLNGGNCSLSGSDYTCTCPPEYTGNNCEEAVCNPPCYNLGRCVSPGVCTCEDFSDTSRSQIFYGSQCQHVLRCPATTGGNASFSASLPPDYRLGTCNEGYVGKAYRACNYDQTWGPIISSCVLPQNCPAETYFRSEWPSSPEGLVHSTCPPGTTGNPYRMCNAGGVWSSYVYDGCKED